MRGWWDIKLVMGWIVGDANSLEDLCCASTNSTKRVFFIFNGNDLIFWDEKFKTIYFPNYFLYWKSPQLSIWMTALFYFKISISTFFKLHQSQNSHDCNKVSKMFSAKLRTNGLWLAKSLSGCAIASYTLSNHVLTDQRLETAFETVKPYLPQPLLKGLAFATPDHGMHPAHYPWYWFLFFYLSEKGPQRVLEDVRSFCVHSILFFAKLTIQIT